MKDTDLMTSPIPATATTAPIPATPAAAPAATHATTFADLGLNEHLLRALTAEGYTTPTPIQAQAIPTLLAGTDVLGIAQTGTGKTAAFALPMLHRLMADRKPAKPSRPRALILSPTRELALQIRDGFAAYGRHSGLKHACIHGGVGQNPQVKALAAGCDILVATPGRLLDLMNQRHAFLDAVEVFVLDEADRMLDMGFIHDMRAIIAKLPANRQNLLFSATMPEAVMSLAKGILRNHKRIEITPQATTVERIEQRVMFVTRENKKTLLNDLLKGANVTRALVFTRTKHVANRIAEQIAKSGIGAEAIHGNKSQNARQRSLAEFKSGKVRVLVATDIAARGIDVDGITHVINYELPMDAESYVHRIGRTARAGTTGIAISFCDAEEVGQLRVIERMIRQPITVDISHGYHAAAIASRTDGAPLQARGGRPGGGGNRNGGGRGKSNGNGNGGGRGRGGFNSRNRAA
jgi:ATP-dependent RNA helicase RhlE